MLEVEEKKKVSETIKTPGNTATMLDGQKRGEIATQKDGYNKYGVPEKDTIKTLTEIGITRKESSIFQAIASIPDKCPRGEHI